jgi:hypothetical protein
MFLASGWSEGPPHWRAFRVHWRAGIKVLASITLDGRFRCHDRTER